MLAWFYHDVVYVIGDKNNEDNSARRMNDYALGRLPLNLVMQAAYHISYTADHFNHMSSKTVQMDLSVLWAPRHEYLRYVEQIEAEYRQVYSDTDFARGREAFLRKCLDYFDDGLNFDHKITPQAIDNIQFEIEHVIYDH